VKMFVVGRAPTAAQQQGQAVACVACEDKPAPQNNPCGWCGRTAPPSAPVGVEAREHADVLARQLRWSMTSKRMRAALEAGIAALTQQPAAVDEKYSELIYAVSSKYPGESRHETALRYIRQAESADHGPAQTDTQHQEPPHDHRG